jgi:YidB-like protein
VAGRSTRLPQTLAEKTGLSEQDVTAQLSNILPAFVDKLTPQGRVPTNDEIARLDAWSYSRNWRSKHLIGFRRDRREAVFLYRAGPFTDVRYWHLAAFPRAAINVAFGGKADMAIALRNVR